MFLDEAVVEFRSGSGGDGCAAFHREKHVPRGGPNGADGGRGGDIVLIADRGKRTLYEFQFKRLYEAGNGADARGNKAGRDGEAIEIHVPIGTIVHDLDLGEPIADLNADGMRVVVARGGRGGRGNQHYVTSVRQAPSFAQKGEPGEVLKVKLELKLLADVGLVGLPNAGKSTFLGRISAARPKIADYPFTTIIPNLGVVSLADKTFVVADLPGLIEGASQGVGLGHQFLRHVERTKVLIHLVDAFPLDGTDPLESYRTVERELGLYSDSLRDRPRLIALNKMDLSGIGEDPTPRFQAEGLQVFPISGVTGQGTDPLLFATLAELERQEATTPAQVLTPTFRPQDEEGWRVEREEEGYAVVGKRVERMVAMTDLEHGDAVRLLHRRLVRWGVIEALRAAGAQDGDPVRIGDFEFEFTEAS